MRNLYIFENLRHYRYHRAVKRGLNNKHYF